MRELIVAGFLAVSLLMPVGSALAQSSVAIPPPGVTPPIVLPPGGGGLGRPNAFSNTVPPASTPPFQTTIANPFNNPHPMLPWGDGQIGGERYGQVIRYWEQQPQTVYSIVLVPIAQEEAKPEAEPQSQPGTPTQAALEARKQLDPRDVTVPGSWIAETTRGYVHMPRWALQDIGSGRHQWVLVGAWFQPK